MNVYHCLCDALFIIDLDFKESNLLNVELSIFQRCKSALKLILYIHVKLQAAWLSGKDQTHSKAALIQAHRDFIARTNTNFK